ncbi:cell division protein ZapB [Pigmentiphaga litoralis]|uniref:cell division protein ZapB n=1 Tax=Pigmentiphaga litoralis TaxID=516702 RepID=UPI003B43ADE5
MLEDLDQLSTRIAQLVQLTQHVRAENQALRDELGKRDVRIQQLRDTVEMAQIRVDDVLARLPGKPPEAADAADADAAGGSDTDIDLDDVQVDDADGDWADARTDADTDPSLSDDAGHGVRSAHGTP